MLFFVSAYNKHFQQFTGDIVHFIFLSPFRRTILVDFADTLTVFLSRVSTLTRDIDIAVLSVRLSVRNVPVLDENGLTYRHRFFTIR